MTYFDGLFFLPPTVSEAEYRLHFRRAGRVLWKPVEGEPRPLPAPVAWWTVPQQRDTFSQMPGDAGDDHLQIAFCGPRARQMQSGGLIGGDEAPTFVFLRDAGEFERLFGRLLSLEAPENAAFETDRPTANSRTFQPELDTTKSAVEPLDNASEGRPASGRAVLLLEELFLSLREQNSTAPVWSPLEQEVNEWLESVKSAPQREWNLAAVTAQLSVSPGHFRRVCRKLAGVSPYQFVLERRLDAAATRLRGSKEPIKSLAPACGFGDLNQFARLFAARYHLPPAAYRRASRVVSLETARLRRRQKLPTSLPH